MQQNAQGQNTKETEQVASNEAVEVANEAPAITKPQSAAKPEPLQVTLTPAQKITQRLIEQGKFALASDRLLTPEEDNANLYFQAALGRDPGNFDAIQGISAIVDRYTQWAWLAAQGRRYGQAQQYLEQAKLANPEDPVIAEMTTRINDLKKKRQQVAKPKPVAKPKEGQYLLPKNLFSLSDEEIIAKMQPIIDKVAATQSGVEIYWPKDKEARLLYQIINSRVSEFRVRGMTYSSTKHMVELQQD
ncbi:hypothetical protein GCM10027340_20590 [Marinomonas epiphytica]